METNARTNYVYVDYENVQELDLSLIQDRPVKVVIIVGPHQKALPTTLTKQIHRFHSQVELVECETAGRNALDLVLAYHLGLQAKADPGGYFHILSRDKDYEALVRHLRKMGIRICRDEEFEKVSALIDVDKLSLEERADWVKDRIARNKASRPVRKKALLASIHSNCRKLLSDVEVEQILDRLIVRKVVSISAEDHVTYKL